MILSDYLKQFPNDLPAALAADRAYRELWSYSRRRHQNNYASWRVDTPGMLRDATVIPHVWEWDLKPGYFWPELIH